MNRLEPQPIDFDKLEPIPQGSTLGAEWWLAISHLRSKKQEAFLSLVTILSIVGVVAGVATLNMVLSVMTGFEADLRDKILGANAHIVVMRYGGNVLEPEKVTETIESIPGVAAAAPMVYTESLLRSPWGHKGIILKGIDPLRTQEVTSLRDDLKFGPEGELTTLEQKEALFRHMGTPFPSPVEAAPGEPEQQALPGILLGKDLAEILQVDPGDKVQLIDPLGGGTGPMGMPMPRVRQLRVAGVYQSGMYDFDTSWTYVANSDAQSFLEIGDSVTGIEVRVTDIDDVENVSAKIEEVFGYPSYTRHWKELNQALFEALELEKVVMGLILFLIVGVAALLIVTTLIMIVITKGKEIAILKAMGASRGTVLRIFMIEGSVIGIVGTGVGTILGLAGCWFLDWYRYPLQTDVYFLSELPVVVEPQNVVVIALAALGICFVATLYPAWRAAALDPVEGLRYE